MIVFSKDKWREAYKDDKYKIWFWIYFGENFLAFNDYNDWYKVVAMKKKITKVCLQYRSQIVETVIPEDCEGVYLVRSILGRIGEEPIHTTTIGALKDRVVNKKIYINTGLIEKYTESSNIEDCFEEAFNFQKEECGKA